MCRARSIASLSDISNNGLPFNEDSMQLALEALVRDTNITGLNIGGNIQAAPPAPPSRANPAAATRSVPVAEQARK